MDQNTRFEAEAKALLSNPNEERTTLNFYISAIIGAGILAAGIILPEFIKNAPIANLLGIIGKVAGSGMMIAGGVVGAKRAAIVSNYRDSLSDPVKE
jgi:hypothetical protein